MKTVAVSLLFFGWILSGFGQGTFHFSNPGARTRIGSIDGELAGPQVWAQMFAGATPDSLVPVGNSAQHIENGVIFGGTVTIPTIAALSTAYIQMGAWDGNLWGTALGGVPLNQLGRTDIVPVILAFPFQPAPPPLFTQPAIVPVPEPSTISLVILGVASLLFFRRRRRSKRQA